MRGGQVNRCQDPREYEVMSWDKQTPVHSDFTEMTPKMSPRDKIDQDALYELQNEVKRLQNEMKNKDE